MGDEMQACVMAQLLDEVKSIVIRNHAESFRQGKEFNIFKIQGISSDEVRVCRFMKELLDPKGSHGQGDAFLRIFMRDVLKTDVFSDDEYRNARVVQEEVIDNARRIDLDIHIGGRRLFPIEVKIYASDQESQCYDYFQYAKNIDSEVIIYYLTLDGHEPSKMSKGELSPDQYICLSFSDEILAWLDNCLAAPELERVYSVREMLIQFRDVIRELTGRQKGQMMSEIKEKISSSYESIKAAKLITEALPDAKIDLMQKVFEHIKSHMDTHMESMGNPERVDLYKQESVQYYRSGKQSCPSLNYVLHIPDEAIDGKIALRFEIGEYLYIGITTWFGKNNNTGEKTVNVANYVRSHLKPADIAGRNEKDKYWYWWKYLSEGHHANFNYMNEEYLKLFSKEGFDEYMKEVCSMTDSVLRSIKLLPEQ